MAYDVDRIKYCRNANRSNEINSDRMRTIGRFIRRQMSGSATIFEKQFQKIS